MPTKKKLGIAYFQLSGYLGLKLQDVFFGLKIALIFYHKMKFLKRFNYSKQILYNSLLYNYLSLSVLVSKQHLFKFPVLSLTRIALRMNGLQVGWATADVTQQEKMKMN